MKALFFKKMIWMSGSMAALLGVSAVILSAQQTDAPAGDGTSTAPADKLLLEPPVLEAPGLMRWLGDPVTKASGSERVEWVNDGSVMYAGLRMGGQRTEVWKPEVRDGVGRMVLKGFYHLGNEWGISPDGRWLVGVRAVDNRLKFRVYRADTLEVVWERDVTSSSSSMVDRFTLDSEHLSRVEVFNSQTTITVLNAETGKDTFSRSFPKSEGYGESELRMVAGKDYFLLSPAFDLQRRVTKLDAKTGAMVAVTEPMEGFDELEAMELSPNGDCLVLWDKGSYQVMKWKKSERYETDFTGEIEVTYNRYGSPINRLNSVKISPGSDTLVVSGGMMHKVVRLADQKVLHSSTEECRCGQFEPQGRVFISTCLPYRMVDVQSWEYRVEGKDHTLREAAEQVAFSPDGRYLAVFGCLDIDVWDWQSGKQQPSFKLVTADSPERLCRLAWKDNETIYGGNFSEFLKWKLPANTRVQMPHQRIKGEKLFDTYASLKSKSGGEVVKAGWQTITVAPVGTTCLVSMDGKNAYTELRFADKPGLVKPLNIPKGSLYPIGDDVVFEPNGKRFFYVRSDRNSRDQLFAYDVGTDVLQQSTEEASGELIGYDAARGRVVGFDRSRGTAIKLWDATTLKKTAEHQLATSYSWSDEAALSKDGLLMACVGRNIGLGQASRSQVILINVNDGKAVGTTVELDREVTSLAFAPDGRHLAAGMGNGVVGIWQVETLLKDIPLWPEEKKVLTPVPSVIAARPQPMAKEWPGWEFRGVLPNGFQLTKAGGEIWRPLEDGSLVVGEGQSVGALKIDGKAVQVLGQRSRFLDLFGMPGFVSRTELKCEVEGLRAHRYLRGSAHGVAEWRDELENVGSEPVKVRLSFDAALGGGVDRLRLPNREALERLPGNELGVPEKVVMLGTFDTGNEGAGVKGRMIRFATEGAKQRPRLRWDQEAGAVVSEWEVELQSGERCMVLHQYVHFHGNEEDTAWLAVKHASAFGYSPMSLLEGFPVPLNVGYEGESEQSKKSFMEARKVDEDGWLVDELGLKWKTGRGAFRGMASELGIHTVLGLRLNGEPAAFETARRSGPQRWLDEVYEADVLNGKWKVERRSVYSKEHAAYATHDTVVNPSDTPVRAVVEATVVGKSKINKLIAEDGKELDLSAPVLRAGGERGFVTVIFDGDQEPALLVAMETEFGEMPKLQLIGDRILAIRYELELKPGERKLLKHVAAPRPWAVYGSLEAAVSSWNPAAVLGQFAPLVPVSGAR